MLYTYSRDDAYQQVKKRNKQLALEARRLASESQNVLSPRKAGGDGEGSKRKQWVYKTPKIIRDLVRNRNLPDGEVGEDRNKKKSKIKIRFDDDSNEDIDVETVDNVVEEYQNKQKVKRKLDKPIVRKPRKSKGDSPIKSPRGGMVSAACSTEATKLDSLPGYSIPSQREGIFEKLHAQTKGSTSRANIFEQFGVQPPPAVSLAAGISVVQAPGQPPVFQNAIPSGTVRLINTPQGQKMVVVSSNSFQNQQSPPQNVVLLQGMQGFPQGIMVGNNIVSLQGTPLNVTPVARAGQPISIQTPRIVASPQIVSPKFGPRIVTPVVSSVQQNPALVQRFVTGQRVNPSVLQGSAVQVSQLNQTSPPGLVNVSSFQHIANLPQIRLNTPLVHTSGGQLVSLQQTPTPPQRKSSVQTIASLIAAGKASKHSPPIVQQPTAVQPQAPRPSPPINLANLANLMRAQIPATTSSPVQTQSQVRVNPAVAKLVASHIHSVSSNAGQSSASQSAVSTRSVSPAVISLATCTTRSQSPTVVKVVSVSRTASPTVCVASAVRPPTGPIHRGENPVATINIKGLPPGVSIPASLVNSLVSGSIGGMAKGGLRGVVPQSTTPVSGAKKTVVRLTQPTEVNAVNSVSQIAVKPVIAQKSTPGPVNEHNNAASPKLSAPVGRGITPVTASASPPATMQAWSNPNLVIRTRRAAIKSPVALLRSPQTCCGPVPPAPDGPKTNGPTPTPVANHVAKNIQQTNIPLVVQEVDNNEKNSNNEDLKVIEIT